MKWIPFDEKKGYHQKRPPKYKNVLVVVNSQPKGIAVGYRKDAAGDASCPYFVVTGIGGTVLAWCDCLPDDFDYMKARIVAEEQEKI